MRRDATVKAGERQITTPPQNPDENDSALAMISERTPYVLRHEDLQAYLPDPRVTK